MSEWKEYKLGEIVTFQRGHDLPKDKMIDGDFPVAGSNGIIGYHNQFTKEGPGVTIGRSGNIGIPHYYPNAYWAHNTVLYIIDFKGNDAKFMYYLLKTFDFTQLNTGSAVPSLNRNHIHELPVSIPNVSTQHRIASILSSLDDKIDLLHRENATLEQMAETLFRQWFVVEAKEEWEEGKLGDYVELVNGVSYKGDELQPSNVAMVTLKSFDRNGGFRMDGYKEFTGKFKKEQVLYDGDLVVAHTDITQEADVIGNPVIVIGKNQYETITFSMDVVKVVSKSEFFSNSFLYYLMKTQAFKEHCLGYANGSTVLHLSKKAIPEFEFHIPPKIIAQSFQKQVESINKKILNNNNEIQTLIQTRDGLLPRLMSGEINV